MKAIKSDFFFFGIRNFRDRMRPVRILAVFHLILLGSLWSTGTHAFTESTAHTTVTGHVMESVNPANSFRLQKYHDLVVGMAMSILPLRLHKLTSNIVPVNEDGKTYKEYIPNLGLRQMRRYREDPHGSVWGGVLYPNGNRGMGIYTMALALKITVPDSLKDKKFHMRTYGDTHKGNIVFRDAKDPNDYHIKMFLDLYCMDKKDGAIVVSGCLDSVLGHIEGLDGKIGEKIAMKSSADVSSAPGTTMTLNFVPDRVVFEYSKISAGDYTSFLGLDFVMP